MKERFEFRVEDADARRLLGTEADQFRLIPGGPRVIQVESSDPRFEILREEHVHRTRSGREGLFYSWDVRRSYSRRELEACELIRVDMNGAFEPSGETCGTVYDESNACPECGAGRIQASPLALDLRPSQPEHDIDTTTLGHGKDIAKSIADEIVVSDRFAGWLADLKATGVNLASIVRCHSANPLRGWYQPIVTSAPVEVIEPTTYGKNPFDIDIEGEFRCPRGHVAGLNLLTELTVRRASWDGADVVLTRQLSGRREGVLVPAPELLVSRRLYLRMREEKARGMQYEAVHAT